MDGWMDGGRSADCYHKEGCYHKHFRCSAINREVLITLDRNISSTKQGFVASQVPEASFLQVKGMSLDLPISLTHCENNWQIIHLEKTRS